MTTRAGRSAPHTSAVHLETPRPTRALAVAGVLTALASAAFIASFPFYPDDSFNEVIRSPYVVTVNLLAASGLMGIAVLLPSALAGRVPGWVRYVAAAAAGAAATLPWTMGTFAADLARYVTEEELNDLGVLAVVAGLPKMLLGLVGFVALGVLGRRRGIFGRPVAGLFVVAGVASLMWPYPPAGVLGGLAVLGLARALSD